MYEKSISLLENELRCPSGLPASIANDYEDAVTALQNQGAVANEPPTTQGEKCIGCSNAVDGKTRGQTGPCSFCRRTYRDLFECSGTSAVA
jgi:hypothetical protein